MAFLHQRILLPCATSLRVDALQLRFERRVRWVLATLLAAALVLGAVMVRSCADAEEATRKAAQTQQLLSQLSFVRSSTLLIELETQSVRFATQANSPRPQEAQISRREASLSLIRSLVRDSAPQQARWLQLRQVIDERVAIVSEALRLRQEQGPAAAAAFMAKTTLTATRQHIHALLDAMEADALQQLRQQGERQNRARGQLRWMLAAAAALLLGLLSAGCALIRSQSHAARRLRQDVAAREEHMDVALRSIGDAVLITDAEGHVRRMNPAAERLLACSQAQAHGQTVEELLTLLDVDGPASAALSSLRAAENSRGSAELVRLRRADGSVRDAQLSAAPLWGGNRDFLGSVYVVRDISDELALQALLRTRTDAPGHEGHQDRAPAAQTGSSSCAPAA